MLLCQCCDKCQNITDFQNACALVLWQRWLPIQHDGHSCELKDLVSLYLKKWQMLLCHCCDKCKIILVSKKLVCRYCDNAGFLQHMDISLSWKTFVSLYFKKWQKLVCRYCDKCQITACALIVTILAFYNMTDIPVSWQTFVSLNLKKMSNASVPLLWQMPNYYGFQNAYVLVLWQRWLSIQHDRHSSELKNLCFFKF